MDEETATPEEIDAGAGGRPAFAPTKAQRDWVTKAASIGVPQEVLIKKVVNEHTDKPIAGKTLRLHFRKELDEGLAEVGEKLLTTGFIIATDPLHSSCAYMNQFLCKTRLGMKETSVTELTDGEGGPVKWPQLVIIRNGNKDPEPE